MSIKRRNESKFLDFSFESLEIKINNQRESNFELPFKIISNIITNQMKVIKQARAYCELEKEIISNDEYEKVEDECSIKINKISDEEAELRYMILSEFLEDDFELDFDELSEILSISPKQAKRVINKIKKHGFIK